MQHRDGGIGGLLSFRIKARSSEVDVIGLPGKGRQAHRDVGGLEAVKAATPLPGIGADLHLDVGALVDQSEAVEDLDFVTVLQVDPAVAAILAAQRGFRFIREPELKVHGEVTVFLHGLGRRREDPLFPLSLEQLGIDGVAHEDVGPSGRFFPKGGALPMDLLAALDGNFCPRLVGKRRHRCRLVPSGPRQAALECAHVEIPFAQGGHLHPGLFSGVLALNRKIRVFPGRLGGISPDRAPGLGAKGHG